MLTRKTGRCLSLIILATLLGLSLIDFKGFWTAKAQDPNGDYEEELLKGRALFQHGDFEGALKSFKRANDMREKKCAECYSWMADTYFMLEAYKNVVESADKVIELASDDRQLVLKAYNSKGRALQAWAEKKDQKKLEAAEAVFRQALTLEGAPPVLRYNLGVVLLQLNRDAEGVAELKQYLQSQPTGPYVESARRMVENPRRARENYAPDVSFTSSEGEYISLDDLKGKVVVLDFWGTWCPPCVESIPDLRNLQKRYAKEPAFMLIGISSDHDEEVWRDFTEKNKMVWPQYLDKDHHVQRAFGVHAFPTYIVIDHEGIVRYQSVGMSWQRAASLSDAVGKLVKAVAKSTEPR